MWRGEDVYLCSTHEACVLENIWRERVLLARRVSLSLIFLRILPLEIVHLIALRVHPKHVERVTNVIRRTENGVVTFETKLTESFR